jgi:hypothetical protein
LGGQVCEKKDTVVDRKKLSECEGVIGIHLECLKTEEERRDRGFETKFLSRW